MNDSDLSCKGDLLHAGFSLKKEHCEASETRETSMSVHVPLEALKLRCWWAEKLT